ncbi:ionotropic receptor 25a-like isoform X2 [Tachypleus tridentatus]|uniref:ionotropic receptor 25a-like isoform X2 n=1 Tax=Tachypleus tridentatus TaxID=6853 RepID=UPI003FD5506A
MAKIQKWLKIRFVGIAFLLLKVPIYAKPIHVVVTTDTSDENVINTFREALTYSSTIDIGSVTEVKVDSSDTEETVCKQIMSGPQKPTVLIDVTFDRYRKSTENIPIVKKIAQNLGIPTVTTNRNQLIPEESSRTVNTGFLVPVSSFADVISDVISDVASLDVIKTCGILHDDSIALEDKYSTLLENKPIRHVIRKLKETEEEIGETINNLYKYSGIVNFFVIGNLSTINKTLAAAVSKRMTGKGYSWFFVTKDDARRLTCNCSSINFMLFSLQEIKPKEVDDSVPTQALSRQLDLGSWPTTLDYPECGMTMNEKQNDQRKKTDLLSAINQVSREGVYNRPLIITNKTSYREVILNIAIIEIINNQRVTEQKVGVWSPGYPERIVFNDGFSKKTFDDFKAVIIYKITTVVQPPFVQKVTRTDGSEEFQGYCIDLINNMKKILQFEFEISESPDKMFGIMNASGGWNGMIKELIDKKADIALAPLSVMAERETVVDFTVPFYDLVGISILMKKPQVPSSIFKFLTVLETNVWASIIGAYFFTSFLMYAYECFSPYSNRNNNQNAREFNLKECLWFCITSLTPQGGGEAPRNLSGRLVAATWWLFGFIIIASYTANLAAFLTVSRLDSPITSLDDLANQYKIKYAPQRGSSSQTYFERMAYIEERFYEIWKDMSLNDSLSIIERTKLAVWDYPISDKYTKIWLSIKEANMPLTFEEGVRRVKESKGSHEGFAFIADSTQVKYATFSDCDLQVIGDEFSRKPMAIAVQEGSYLRDQLSSAILELLNQRKLEELKEKWWNTNSKLLACEESEERNDGIGIENIGGVFIVIGVGVVIACLTLFAEHLYYKTFQPATKIVPVKKYQISSPKINRY